MNPLIEEHAPLPDCDCHRCAIAERDRARELLATMRPFFEKHGFGPKLKPSCLVCGRNDSAPAIQHLELPGIVICADCSTPPSENAMLTDGPVRAMWDRLQWGVEFRGRDGRSMLLGEMWALTAGTPNPLPDSPTRALMFTTREAARKWCASKNREWREYRDGVVQHWRVRPVRVRELVEKINAD